MSNSNWFKIVARQAIGRGLALAFLSAGLAPVAAEDPADTETLKKKTDPPEAAKTDTEQPDKKADDKEKPDTPEAKPKPGLTQKIIDELIGKAKEQAENPLDPIVERMRAAQQRLQKTETDVETRKLQTQIVQDLDELIELLKNLDPPSKSSSNSPPPPPMGGSEENQPLRGQPQPKPQNSQKQKAGTEKKPAETTPTKPGDKSKQSTNQNQGQPRSPEEEAARQRLAKDVWGHLPPALRQQLLNVYSEKFLPKYDDLVRKYYEALAEQNRKNP